MYDNTTRVIQWLLKHARPERIPKPFPHEKILLSFWFTSREVLHCSLLPDRQTITADLFIENMLETKRKLLEKYSRHREKRTQETVRKESISITTHPAYSQDINLVAMLHLEVLLLFPCTNDARNVKRFNAQSMNGSAAGQLLSGRMQSTLCPIVGERLCPQMENISIDYP
ncbi:unnamed protein product [Heligmosomoides polygyrus]|uniref:Histone-lysine N-methyltransferase SETMAR n=1 Tax=Heligmosomoides polygyrus TaxID=6339 RepID=A0A183GVG6_HELPZ|nr:unnamed protein product [Heligmosomoides polygyrus]